MKLHCFILCTFLVFLVQHEDNIKLLVTQHKPSETVNSCPPESLLNVVVSCVLRERENYVVQYSIINCVYMHNQF